MEICHKVEAILVKGQNGGEKEMDRCRGGKIKAKLKATRRDDRGVDAEKHQDAWRENSC